MGRFLLYFRILAVILIIFSSGSQNAAAQIDDSPGAAFDQALISYNTAHGFTFAITEIGQEGGFAYAVAGPGADYGEELFAVFLAERINGAGWRTLTPTFDAASDYNNLLERVPDSLLDEGLKAMFRQPDVHPAESGALESQALMAAANFTGHRLPWAYKTTAYVTQKDSYEGHMNQIDFDIGGKAVPNGDIYASRPGRVVFVKDSSNHTCKESTTYCMRSVNMIVIEHGPGEYSWYLHLAYRSATVITGQQVGFGTKIGAEGETGYSFGVHLHYMASTGHTAWTDPNDPHASPWATGITAVDFDEYSWAALVQTYTSVYTSQNGANLPPVCPAAGGALLYRETDYNCAGLLENSGYSFYNEPGFHSLTAFNDLASSARIPQGWSVMLYENANRTGGKKCLNASDGSFANDTFDNNVPLDNRVSSIEVFNTPNCPVRPSVDLIAPNGSLTSPTNGAAVGRTIQLTSNASDGQSGVQMVQFTAKWGGQSQIIYTDTSAPYTYTWDVCASGVPDGTIELGHSVVDKAWNSTTSQPITVTKTHDCAAVPQGNWSVDYWNNTNLSGTPPVHEEQPGTFVFKSWELFSPGPGIPADGWSARFTRTFSFPGGNYRFHCQSAGGCRVKIDGEMRINAWEEAAYAGNDWSGTIPAGDHTVTVEFFDASGEARLETWWQGPGFLPVETACMPGQWCAEVWGNPDFRGEPAVRRDEGETLRRSWGTGGPYPMLPGDNFSQRYKREEHFDCGTYRFAVTADGPARLIVDGVTRIDRWVEPGTTASYTVDLPLSRGTHTLVMENADLTGPAGLTLSWDRQSSCTASAAVESVSTHIARPNARFEPRVQVRLTEGYLNPARGDGLAYVSGNTLSAGPGLVRQVVENGQTYTFDASNGFQMIAPAANGLHSGQWRIQAGGGSASTQIPIQVIVDGASPTVGISAPTGPLNGSTIPIRANVSDAHSGASHVQFMVWANPGGGAKWHVLGWDSNGADGWGINWDASGFPDQKGVVFLAAAWDKAGNYAEARSAALTLDRVPPSAAITGPATIQDTTRFLVQWSGSDSLSGLHHYDVQVRIDGGAAQNWMMNVPPSTTSAWYVGEMGRSYAFQVRAVDSAGNASAYTAPTAAAAVRICAPDAFEPDNQPGQAREVLSEVAAAKRSLCASGDVDWYVFQAKAGQLYLIQTHDLGATTDTVLTLYAANGQTKLAENDLPNQQASVLLWKPTVDGPLYFSVRHVDPRVTGSAVTYSVRVYPATQLFLPRVTR